MLVMSSTLILAFVDLIFVRSKLLNDFPFATHFQEPEPEDDPYKDICERYTYRSTNSSPSNI